MTTSELAYVSELSQEQINIVVDDSKYVLVTSAAGSGKTRVLLSKYIYLTKVCDIEPDRILYLSYNRKNIEDIKEVFKSIYKNTNIKASTINAIALKIIQKVERVWPSLLEDVNKAYDKNLVDHNKAKVFLASFAEKIEQQMNENARFKSFLLQHYSGKALKRSGHFNEPNAYVTYLTDRNGRPGSCRSASELNVFEWLVLHDVDFEYERADKEKGIRPDFHIYLEGNTNNPYVLEILSSNDSSNFCDEKQGKEYLDNIAKKKGSYKQRFIELDGSLEKDCLLNKLSNLLSYNNIPFSKQINNEKKEEHFTKCVNKITSDFRELRDYMVLKGYEPKSVENSFKNSEDDFGIFFNEIFMPLEKIYSSFLDDENVYSDFNDSLIRASQHLKNPDNRDSLQDYRFNYVLVDEFQDMAFARHALLLALKEYYQDMHLLAVGDDRQAIYSFSGCDLEFFRNFEKYWPDAKRMTMKHTFRFGEPCAFVSSNYVNSEGGTSTDSIVGNYTPTGIELFLRETGKNDSDINDEVNYCAKIIVDIARYLPSASEKNLLQNRPNRKPEVLIVARNNKPLDDIKKKIKTLCSQKDIDLSHLQIEYSTIHSAKGKTVDYLFFACADILPFISETHKASITDKLVSFIEETNGVTDLQFRKIQEEARLAYVAMTRARLRTFFLFCKKTKLYDKLDSLLKQYNTSSIVPEVNRIPLFPERFNTVLNNLENLNIEDSHPILYLLTCPEKVQELICSFWLQRQTEALRCLYRENFYFYQWVRNSQDMFQGIIQSANPHYPQYSLESLLFLVRFLYNL